MTGADDAEQSANPRPRSPYDVRPHLLALCCRQNLASVLPCVDYGRNYLHAWCDRCGVRRATTVLGAAAVDGLLRVYWGRDRRGCGRPTLGERTHTLHVDPTRYLTLKRVAETAYRRRLAEALKEQRFTPADPHTETRIRERPSVFPNPPRRAAPSPATIAG